MRPVSDYIKDLRVAIGHKSLLTPGVVAIIHNDAVLRGLPGGQLEPLEPPALGLIREVFEETGLKVAPVSPLGIFGGNDAFHVR